MYNTGHVEHNTTVDICFLLGGSSGNAAGVRALAEMQK